MDVTRGWPLAFSALAPEGYFKVLICFYSDNHAAFS